MNWQDLANYLLEHPELQNQLQPQIPTWWYLEQASNPGSPNLGRAPESPADRLYQARLPYLRLLALRKKECGSPLFGANSEFDEAAGEQLWVPADSWTRPDGGTSILMVPIPEDGSARVVDAATGNILYWIYSPDQPSVQTAPPALPENFDSLSPFKQAEWLRENGREDEALELEIAATKGASINLMYAIAGARAAKADAAALDAAIRICRQPKPVCIPKSAPGQLHRPINFCPNAGSASQSAGGSVQPTTPPTPPKTISDFPGIGTKTSQKQLRHIKGRPEYRGGGYFDNAADAQSVLDAFHSGGATIIGTTNQGFPVVKYCGVTGTNVNVLSGFLDQPTNVFIIKGTASPSVVPANPNWGG